jgi:DnaK suppressor protein
MPAKKSAPKPGKGKKAVSRPAARKSAVRKPAERAKAASHARATVVASTTRKAPARPAAPTQTSTETANLMRTAAEPAAATPTPEPRPTTPPQAAVPPRVQPVPPASADGEEGEAAEPGSLLAGPRNVQPYITKRGEQYMSKEQSEHFRQILLSWKRDLMVEVDRTVTHMKDEAANFPDPNDRATQEEEFSLELRTRDRERKLIRKIDEALKRIEDGSYGYCLETGEEIGVKRLEARPVATLSIEAQERRERRERQYGDRDDRYR